MCFLFHKFVWDGNEFTAGDNYDKYRKRRCTRCGTTSNVLVDCHEHTFTKWEFTDIYFKSYQQRICTVCGLAEQRVMVSKNLGRREE